MLAAQGPAQVGRTFDIGYFKAPVTAASDGARKMNYRLAVVHQRVQGLLIVQVAAYQLYAECLQISSCRRIANQPADFGSFREELATQ